MLSMLTGSRVFSREMSFNMGQIGPAESKSRSFARQDVAHGDTHGNVLRMIKFLQGLNGALEILAADEKALNAAIDSHNQLIQQGLSDTADKIEMAKIVRIVENIIARIKLHPEKVGRVIWLGDTICDRGPNDYFTALLYQKLHKEKFPFTITMSNHDAVALQAMADKVHVDKHRQFNSYNNLALLIQKGIVSEKIFKKILDESYKSHLNLINYTLRGDDSLVLYPHSRVPLGSYKRLADHFEVKWDCSTVYAFAAMIRKINEKFASSGSEVKPGGIINNFIWNDPYNSRRSFVSDKMTMTDDVPEEVRAKIYQVHGHIGPHKDEARCVSLDNDIGRYEAFAGTRSDFELRISDLSAEQRKQFEPENRRYVKLDDRSGYHEQYKGRMSYTAEYPLRMSPLPFMSMVYASVNLGASFAAIEKPVQDNPAALFSPPIKASLAESSGVEVAQSEPISRVLRASSGSKF